MIKNIITDLGGVYLNKGVRAFWLYLDEKYSSPFEQNRSVFMNYFDQCFTGKISEELFWGNIIRDLKLDGIDWKLLKQELLDGFYVQEDVVKLYRDLRTKGYKLILLSDQTKEWWKYLDNKFNINRDFDFIVISALVGFHKPDPRIYRYTLEASKAMPEESIFIDDLKASTDTAANFGMDTCLFESYKQLFAEFTQKGIL